MYGSATEKMQVIMLPKDQPIPWDCERRDSEETSAPRATKAGQQLTPAMTMTIIRDAVEYLVSLVSLQDHDETEAS